MRSTILTYLALGDSYTIGEQVSLYESFPYQTVYSLRKAGVDIAAPEMIAQTGWTTDELEKAIHSSITLKEYDLVSLLVGVNNQYRGRTVKEYETGFDHLLQRAIEFAGNRKQHVFVLSIPDWGATPFAEARLPDAQGRNRKQIAEEIDEFNAVNRKISLLYGVHYIDITAGTREAASDETLLAADQLHPSGKEYARWAELLSKKIFEVRQGSASL